MDILFISDPLSSFNIKKDSTFAMMRTAQARDHAVYQCEMPHVFWQSGSTVSASVSALQLQDVSVPSMKGDAIKPAWYKVLGESERSLASFDAVIMRQDPPFDMGYFYATHLLSQAEREGAKVFNHGASLRNQPEKLSILEFPDYITPTLVTRDAARIKAFHEQHRDIILKPLDGMGGAGIFRVKEDGLNLGSIIETLNQNGRETVMVQAFLPAISQGDKRILIIDGEPVPYCLARIPQGGEVRGNLAAGGKGVAQPLSDSDWAIANALGPKLAARGLLLIGLDVIGDKVTEINVTSPTCFQEITDQTGYPVAEHFIKALERKAGKAI